nr:unnamed protein product [Callosobruchus analis]
MESTINTLIMCLPAIRIDHIVRARISTGCSSAPVTGQRSVIPFPAAARLTPRMTLPSSVSRNAATLNERREPETHPSPIALCGRHSRCGSAWPPRDYDSITWVSFGLLTLSESSGGLHGRVEERLRSAENRPPYDARIR